MSLELLLLLSLLLLLGGGGDEYDGRDERGYFVECIGEHVCHPSGVAREPPTTAQAQEHRGTSTKRGGSLTTKGIL